MMIITKRAQSQPYQRTATQPTWQGRSVLLLYVYQVEYDYHQLSEDLAQDREDFKVVQDHWKSLMTS